MDFFQFFLIFIVVDLILLFFIILYGKRKTFKSNEISFFRTHWEKIIQNNDNRQSLIEADKLLDLFLGKKGYIGSLGDKLKSFSRSYERIDNIWFAHKLRNKLVHEVGFYLKKSDFDKALKAYKEIFSFMGLFK